MQWLLVQFPTPYVATSDEPVVMWPLDISVRRAADLPQVFEFQDPLEVRVPISPRLAIVMTWADAPDQWVAGNRDHARNLNGLTIGQADKQWFHLPAASPPIIAGPLLPLSPSFVYGYEARTVHTSQRRLEAAKYAKQSLADPPNEPHFKIVEVNEESRIGTYSASPHARKQA
jgi:hypothetical protein